MNLLKQAVQNQNILTWVESMGYEVRFKTLAPLVTTVADWLVKS